MAPSTAYGAFSQFGTMKKPASLCGAALALLAANAFADTEPGLSDKSPPPYQANAEFGMGHEYYSSPLVRFNDQGPLIEVVGRRHASGDYRHISASFMKDFPLTDGVSLQMSAAMWNRHFPNARDLDIGIVSVDGIVRFQLGQASLGMGPSFQQIASGGRPFRDRASMQLDWTRVKENKGYTSVVVEVGDNRHSEQFRDLDSRSCLALLREQFIAPARGVRELSIEAGMVREINRFGYADLSNLQVYARLNLGFDMLGLDWNLGGTLQKARFDGPLMDELPSREDSFISGDLSVGYTLSKEISLRWTLSGYRNRSNVVLYDGWFRGNSLSLNAAF